ncbi:hypothetical protein OCT51_09375 [Halomonas sp. LR3S48]|uniref:hypothetical protein n=1 Tax=Halomonas sp. LR3S48 TaxID=2982694 RepID=UPI0021E3F929|nr:hypothetical protein [Halomonas sp. LR3S48]UYG05548.1 hypothetical protein OCT51_09375 [Halomonas sp. LR3S48]
MKEASSSHYDAGAYRAGTIPPIPASPKKRERIGEELLPFGDYAGIDPYQQICEDAELVQYMDQKDKQFYESDDWWWNQRHIKFLSKSTGVSLGIMFVPYSCAFLLFGAVFYLSVRIAMYLESVNFILAIFAMLSSAVLGFYLIGTIGPKLTNWVVINLAKAMERGGLAKHGNSYMENRCSEFNRQTGMVSFAQGKKKPPLKAPFVEFDGYVERVVQRGGIFYRLMFVHRYTGKQFNQTSLSAIVDHKHEVHATWDMLQRYMDVSQPLPDVPRLEPFRHLDPTTAEHDRQTGRNPRYWRDLDLEAWKAGEGAAHLKAQIEYPWSHQRCQLTPQLGKVEMATYREQQQAAVA